MRVAIAVGLALGLAAAAPRASAQAAISPPYYDLTQAEAQGTHAFRIHNYTLEPKTVRVSVAPWRMDPANEPELVPPGPTTLDQWIVVNPVEFKIPPGGSQAIRFSVRPAIQLSPGEYRVMLIFDEVLTGESAPGQVRARFQFRSAVYIQVGTPTRQAEILSVKVDADGATFEVRSSGTANARFDGQYGLWSADRFPGEKATAPIPGIGRPGYEPPAGALALAPLSGTPVLPGDTRSVRITFPKPVPPGRYILDLNGKLGDAALDRSFAVTIAAGPG